MDSEDVEAPPEAMKQTSAEPLDCFVRQPGVLRRICGVSVSVRPAARSLVGKVLYGACRAATSSRIRTLESETVVTRRENAKPRVFGRQFTRGWALSSQRTKGPNKAPEPTRAAVTPRAVVCNFESPKRNVKGIAARVAPAARVAHL
jgi:hypothetical protein